MGNGYDYESCDCQAAMDGTEIESTYSILWGPLDPVKP